MFVLRHKIEGIFLVIITGVMGLFLAISINSPQFEIIPTRSAIEANLEPSGAPTEVPIQESVLSEISSDGIKKVILKIKQNRDGTKVVTLYSEDSESGNQQVIFNINLYKDESMVIPYNTWSPDNKYFFIQKNTTAGPEIMVFNAKGEPFASGETYLDLTGSFRAKETGDIFAEATGWASETLIIVNAVTKDNNLVSYWFEVPSKAIIQLSTVFD